jgi:periplasmic protein TonB
MKVPFSLLFFLAGISPAMAQPSNPSLETYYGFDENWKAAAVDKAVYFLHVVKEGDSLFHFDTYYMNGPLISCEYFKDSKGKVQHGATVYFNPRGTRDSLGNFEKGLQQGEWLVFNDTGRVKIKKVYDHGALVSSIDAIRDDSLKGEEQKRKLANGETVNIDKNFVLVEIESEFPGGQKGWINYLVKNLRYPDRAINLKKQGQVVIQFIVDKEGKVIQPEIIRSVEYSLDREAMRLIKESPRWVPAVQNGKVVKSYKKQPISFRLE